MNGRTILIGVGIVGGLVGLGFLAHYVYGGKSESEPRKEEDKPPIPPLRKVVNEVPMKSTPKKKQVLKKQPEQTTVQPKARMEEMKEGKVIPLPIADEFPLRLGSKGARVERLKVWLMRNFGWTGTITDSFDERTLDLLQKFLKKEQLDEATYYKLKMEKPVHEQVMTR